MWSAVVVVAVALAGCERTPTSADRDPPVPAPPPPAPMPAARPTAANTVLAPPTCLDPEAGLQESVPPRTGDVLELCYYESENIQACWSFDLATATWAPRERRNRVVDPPHQVTVEPGKATVCEPDMSDCRTIPISFPVDADDVRAYTNADRSLIAVLDGPSPIRIVDTAGHIVSTIQPWHTDMTGDPKNVMPFSEAHFVGPTLATYTADTPMSSEIRLFDPKTGKRIGEVGLGMSDALTLLPAEVGTHVFAFVTFDSSIVLVYNVVTGKRVKRYEIPPRGGYDGIAATRDHKALYELRGGTAYRLDLASGKITTISAPACKPSVAR